MSEDFIEDIISGVDAIKSESEMIAKIENITDEKTLDKKSNIEGAENATDVVQDVKGQENKSEGNDLPGVKELAKQLGWREDHVGEDAVDAATYILRSKDIQKSMSQHNKDLKEQLQALNGSVDALKKHNESVYRAEVKRLEAEVVALKKERKSAIELADVDKVEELDKQIDELQKDINAPKLDDQQTQTKTANPVYDEWIKDNQWYLKDSEMAEFADVVANQYVGAPLDRIYKIVRTKVQEVFPEKFETNKPESQNKTVPEVKTPVGPASPVERSSAKGNSASFTKADLTPDQVQIMNQFVRSGIMTEEQYINDIAKLQE